jgi:hypothetical protein
MVDYIPTEKGVSFRNPSTANFQINSRDRSRDLSGNFIQKSDFFQISLQQNLLNGFFTRLGVVEVVFDWKIPNVSAAAGNNTFYWNVSSSSQALTTVSTIVPTGNYQADDLIATIAANMGCQLGQANTYYKTAYAPSQLTVGSNVGGCTWADTPPVGTIYGNNAQFFTVDNTSSLLNRQLNMSTIYTNTSGAFSNLNIIAALEPTVVPIKYVDIICRNLTYNQDLKDGTTNKDYDRDVLYRWNLAWEDNGNIVDAFNNVIDQAYNKFQSRRYLSFPKQIAWTPNQPIGQLEFELIGVGEQLVNGVLTEVYKPLSYWYDTYGGLEWSMNCLVSEV